MLSWSEYKVPKKTNNKKPRVSIHWQSFLFRLVQTHQKLSCEYRYFWNMIFLHEFLFNVFFCCFKSFPKIQFASRRECEKFAKCTVSGAHLNVRMCVMWCGILAITIYSNLREIKFALAPFDSFIEQKSTPSQPKCTCVCVCAFSYISFSECWCHLFVLVPIEPKANVIK